MYVYIVVGCFILADIITGFIKACYHKMLNSTILREGLFHKLTECLAVVLCSLAEYGTNYINIGVDIPAVKVVSGYICIMELISILENLSDVNPAIAKIIKPYLGKFKGGNTDDSEQETD